MKYILKKEYPGSPKLGNTIDNLENDWIENYPEFWELVVEKDYEILSVIRNNNKFIEKVYNQDAIIEPYWKIHSVKRKDGEIFTIGDKYNWKSNKNRINIIRQILLEDNKILIHDSEHISEEYDADLDQIEKIKQPLFTTEDGVNIFEGDNIYWIWDDFSGDIKCNEFTDDCGAYYVSSVLNKQKGIEGLGFSTKEAAEEYILMNKPVLSLKDVASIYISADKPITDTTSFSAQNRRIQDLVKSKIQQSV